MILLGSLEDDPVDPGVSWASVSDIVWDLAYSTQLEKIKGMLDMGTWSYMNGLQYFSSPYFFLGTYELSCQHNPLVINMTHPLNVLSHRTTSVLLNFSSPLVGISAVALRTSSHISPSALNKCIPEPEGQNHQGQR